MEQIRQHEWEPDGMFKKCPHCKVIKQHIFHKSAVYMLPNMAHTTKEPACITRTINATASDKAAE